MATVTHKTFKAFDACGTSAAKKAIYNFVDSDGYSFLGVRIEKSIHDEGVSEDINTALLAAV